jgi:D-alanyl-D-alanine carboxypeptidase
MNEAAAEIGLQSTTFVDPAGLSSDNRSVSSDLVRLLDHTLKNEVIREATELPEVMVTSASGRTYRIESTNDLLRSFINRPPFQLTGGKTGFLPEAGYCFGAVISENGAHEIIVVVLGSESEQSRFQDAKALAAWAYKVYDWPDEI